MIISPAGRFAFIHVPKTGGFSVRTLLRVSYPDVQEMFARHCLARDASRVIHDWPGYFRFGFVRNPWAVQLSMYRYVLGSGPLHPDFRVFGGYGSFGGYLDRHVRPLWEAGQLLIQSDFLYGADDAGLVSFVGKYETLEQDFAEVRRRLNRPVGALPRLNRSEHGAYQEYYDDASKALIARIYATDIARFGYAFR
jgi:hypothetical protein